LLSGPFSAFSFFLLETEIGAEATGNHQGPTFGFLVLISPFPFLDFLLKAIRNTIFAVLAITVLISPHLGLLLCLGVK
jgi:hypothetical protein